ncbi:MAG: Smr/MutS family protein [Treponema sp.]|nr:Smr/MutS family protein [Treponema sp.]
MNFEDILNKWENSNSNKQEKIIKHTNVMETWLRNNEVFDKDKEIIPGNRAANAQERRRLKNKRPDAHIDIHGLTREEAWQELLPFFNNAKNNEMEKLLIIHGKGNHTSGEPVLKRLVMEFIEKCPYAGESGREKSAGGGEGATWVLLKKSK